LATRSPRRTRSQRALDDALRHLGPPEPEEDEAAVPNGEFEDVEARAKRLGVTVEKVLREYRRLYGCPRGYRATHSPGARCASSR
jgi:hypothetical protein